jgi:hypothetical protein
MSIRTENASYEVGFQVLTSALSMKMAVFWVVAPCCLIQLHVTALIMDCTAQQQLHLLRTRILDVVYRCILFMKSGVSEATAMNYQRGH